MANATRGAALRVGLPGLILLVCLYLGLGLAHDVLWPPPASCNVHVAGSAACLGVPNPVNGEIQGGFTADQARTIQRAVRVLELVLVVVVGGLAAWFGWRMLAGRDVLFVAAPRRPPPRHRP